MCANYLEHAQWAADGGRGTEQCISMNFKANGKRRADINLVRVLQRILNLKIKYKLFDATLNCS